MARKALNPMLTSATFARQGDGERSRAWEGASV